MPEKLADLTVAQLLDKAVAGDSEAQKELIRRVISNYDHDNFLVIERGKVAVPETLAVLESAQMVGNLQKVYRFAPLTSAEVFWGFVVLAHPWTQALLRPGEPLFGVFSQTDIACIMYGLKTGAIRSTDAEREVVRQFLAREGEIFTEAQTAWQHAPAADKERYLAMAQYRSREARVKELIDRGISFEGFKMPSKWEMMLAVVTSRSNMTFGSHYGLKLTADRTGIVITYPYKNPHTVMTVQDFDSYIRECNNSIKHNHVDLVHDNTFWVDLMRSLDLNEEERQVIATSLGLRWNEINHGSPVQVLQEIVRKVRYQKDGLDKLFQILIGIDPSIEVRFMNVG